MPATSRAIGQPGPLTGGNYNFKSGFGVGPCAHENSPNVEVWSCSEFDDAWTVSCDNKGSGCGITHDSTLHFWVNSNSMVKISGDAVAQVKSAWGHTDINYWLFSRSNTFDGWRIVSASDQSQCVTILSTSEDPPDKTSLGLRKCIDGGDVNAQDFDLIPVGVQL